MKQVFLLIIVFIATSIQAKVVYLDNKAVANSQENLYSSFAAAYAACTSPGDTIFFLG